MMRDEKDPTLGRMTQVDWTDPELSRLLESTQTLRLDNRGTRRARAVHLRVGSGGAGIDQRALQVGDAEASVLRLLFDHPLAIGQLVSLKRADDGAMGRDWETGSVLACRPGARQEDAARALFIIDLKIQREHSTFGSHGA